MRGSWSYLLISYGGGLQFGFLSYSSFPWGWVGVNDQKFPPQKTHRGWLMSVTNCFKFRVLTRSFQPLLCVLVYHNSCEEWGFLMHLGTQFWVRCEDSQLKAVKDSMGIVTQVEEQKGNGCTQVSEWVQSHDGYLFVSLLSPMSDFHHPHFPAM